MKKKLGLLSIIFGIIISTVAVANPPNEKTDLLAELTIISNGQMKKEALLTAKKWVCLDVSKKRMTKKLDFDIGNEFSLSIDKKYSFKNNNYDYSNGTWKLDGKFLYFFYNAKGTENKTETIKYKIIKLNETTLILKRLERPKGKITFK